MLRYISLLLLSLMITPALITALRAAAIISLLRYF